MNTKCLLGRLTLGLFAASLCSCSHGRQPPAAEGTPTLSLTSTAFANGTAIPARFTCDGADVSPPLRWTAPPQGTRSLALTCDDPDAPGGDWTHWVISDIPPTATGLPEAVPPTATSADGARQGKNSFGRLGYGGPCPPAGSRHHYVFRLYALNAVLRLPVGATAADAQKAAQGHMLAAGTLTGTYQRP